MSTTDPYADVNNHVHPSSVVRRDWWKSAVVYQVYPAASPTATVTASATSAEFLTTTRLDQLRDVESLNHYATAIARGEDPADVIRALAYKGRDNARVPMSWDASPGAGFTTATPWLDLHPLSSSLNTAAQVDDPNSVFSHYRRLIALRHAEPCVAYGTFRMLLSDHEQLYCFERSFGDTRLLVVANLSSAADVIPDLSELAAWSLAEPLIASVPGSSPALTDPLAPWESRVFRLT